MSHTNILENKIKSKLLLQYKNPSGFYPVRCPICNSKEKKGGFKFTPDQIVYNCFRASCNSSCVYEEGTYVSKKFRKLMNAIGVDIPVKTLYANRNAIQKVTKELDSELYEEFDPSAVSKNTKGYPKNLFPIQDNDYYSKRFIKYINERCLPDGEYYYSTDKKWKDRLIIPSFFRGKIIGYIGRHLDNEHKPKYMTCAEEGLFLLKEQRITDTIIVVEGPMDALSIPFGVAVCGNNISKKHAYVLQQANRVILLPDRGEMSFLKTAKKYGWSVCVPPWEEKDVNSAVQKYGKFIVTRMIRDNVYDNMMRAEVGLEMWNK